MGEYRIAAPAALAWTLLGTPQSWPWLTNADFTVDFIGRRGSLAGYCARGIDNAEARFVVVTAGRSATLHRTGPHLADLPEPGPALMSWAVHELSDRTCELRQTIHAQLPRPLAEIWSDPDFADVIETWSAKVAQVRGDTGPFDAAVSVAPLLRANAAYSEAAGTLDAGSVAALRAAGIFRLGVPEVLGGVTADPRMIVSTIEELSRADAAAGWCAFIGNQSAYAAWLDEVTACELFSTEAGFILAGSTAITGRAEPDGDDTMLVTGRWRFNSGCLHADWLMGGVSVSTNSGTAPMLAFFPPGDATVLGTWDVAGLAGTGSHDVVLDGARIPRRQLAPLYTESARFGGQLHRLSPYNIQALLMIGLPLGIARRALDELAHCAEPFDAQSAVEIARMEIALAAARCLALDAVDDYWSQPHAVSPGAQARLALVLRHAVDTAKDVVSTTVRLSAPEVDPHRYAVLRRCLRDAFGAGQHLAVSDDLYRRNAITYLEMSR